MTDRVSAISRLVNRIRDAQDAMIEAENTIKALMPQLDEALQENGMADYVTERGHAFYKEQKGRATNVIDPRKFSEVVSEDDFYACIKVGVTEAKKVLAQRELDQITTVIPPAEKPPVLVVEPVEA